MRVPDDLFSAAMFQDELHPTFAALIPLRIMAYKWQGHNQFNIETAQCKVSLPMFLKLSYALEESIEYFLLDTPYACAETIINREISKKLAKCSPSTLNVASKMIDILLEQQDSLSAE